MTHPDAVLAPACMCSVLFMLLTGVLIMLIRQYTSSMKC